MLIALDPGSPQPLYRQLRAAIVDAIQTGSYEGGRLLPSSRGLAADLGISRNTVNAAYQELVAEGFLESVPRAGYRVTPDLLDHIRRRPVRAERFPWSDRLTPFTGDVGEIGKPGDWARYPFPFVVGQPDPTLFPQRAWNRALRSAMADAERPAGIDDLLDRDDPLLVEMIVSQILPSRGIAASNDEVLVTLGSQNGIFLVGDALLGPGSVVGVEEPGYPDARQIFARRGAALHPMVVDGSGLVVPDDLSGFDAVFVTPSHHYPTNVTMGVARRHQLLAAAAAAGTVLIEDDYDSEFRYQGTPSPALKALDDRGQVVYLGSFSKFLGPGLRLGFVVADAEMIAELRDRRRYALRHPPGLLQRAVALLIHQGDYAQALRRSRKMLKAKWERMVDGVNRHITPVKPPTGGVSLWVEGPPHLDGNEVARAARAEGVVVEPGAPTFLRRPAPRHHLRLGFSAMPIDRIDEGLRRLGAVVAELGTR